MIAIVALRATVSPKVGPTLSLENPSRSTPNSLLSSCSARWTPRPAPARTS